MDESIQAPPDAPKPEPKPKRKYKPRKHLTPIQWGDLRKLYEFGEYTFKQLADNWGISEFSIKRRSMTEKWTERSLVAAVQKKVELSTIELFAAAGMPKDEYIRLMVEGMQKTMTVKNVKEFLKDKDGNIIYDKKGHPMIADRTVQAVDNSIRLEYRKEYAKLTGLYAPPKQAIEPPPPEEDDEPAQIVSSIDEATAEYNAENPA
jgi:hypothetical protein